MDESLRSREQAARAAPDDVVAGRAWVRALDRTGDVGRAWFERCRLARAGDVESGRELDARPRGLRAVSHVARLETDLPLIPLGFDQHTIAFRRGGGGLVGLDARDLSTRWRAEGVGGSIADAAAGLGPFVVHIADRETLALQACATGAEVARVQLPLDEPNDDGGYFPHVASVLASRDRTLVWVQLTALSGPRPRDQRALDGPEVVLIDWTVGGGQVTARRARARDVRGLAGHLVLCATDAGETEAFEALEGAPRWRANGHWQTSDAAGVILRIGHLLHEAVASTGLTRWSVPAQSTGRVVLGADHALLMDPARVRAIQRVDGATAWELVPPAERDVRAVAMAADVVTLALIPTHDRGPATLLALDLVTGERLFERTLEEGGLVDLLPVDDGLVVGLRTLRRTAVVELLG